jgi:hypothetical protein
MPDFAVWQFEWLSGRVRVRVNHLRRHPSSMSGTMIELFTHLLEHWHTMILVVVAVLAGLFLIRRELTKLRPSSASPSTAGERARKAESSAAIVEVLLVAMLVLVISLSLRVGQVASTIEHDLARLTHLQKEGDVERFRQLRQQLDPNLERLFGDHVERELHSVTQALTSKQITLNDLDEFRLLYKETLRQFPRDEFLATSIPSREFFWRDPSVDTAIAEFIRRGGRMKRIFFITNDLAESPEALEIMTRQDSMGVVVYYVSVDRIPAHLNKLYLVASRADLAWQANIDAANRITTVTATANAEEIAEYRNAFQRLLDLNIVQRFVPPPTR